MGVSFKPSYMLANPNLIDGEISWLFDAYMESCLVWTKELPIGILLKYIVYASVVYLQVTATVTEKVTN